LSTAVAAQLAGAQVLKCPFRQLPTVALYPGYVE
jgi:hypothetical protein